MKDSCLIRLLLLLPLIFSVAALAACSCDVEEWNKATFERYDFIAHVQVQGVDEMNGPFDRETFSWRGAMLRIEVLELYRGEKEEMVYAIDYHSSCGVSIRAGEEWVLFAGSNRSGNMFMHGCSPSVNYRSVKGEKRLSWSYPNEIKHWVDTTCQITLPGITYSGAEIYRNSYANGQLEEQTEYLNGQKHGRSVHYYPDGTLMDEREFLHGKPTKLRRCYEQNGRLNFELEYNAVGELIRETNYQKGYDDLYHEILYVPKTGIEKDYYYRTDGTLERLIVRKDWNKLSGKYYDNAGKLIHHLTYDGWEETVLLDSLMR